MKKDWLAAITAAPAIILDLIISPIRTFLWQEKEVLNGGEHDEEADQQDEENKTNTE